MQVHGPESISGNKDGAAHAKMLAQNTVNIEFHSSNFK